MLGNMFKHNFMIAKCICDTFGRLKRGFSGSDQMPLNTLRNTHSNGPEPSRIDWNTPADSREKFRKINDFH